jgi:hypothetical protein
MAVCSSGQQNIEWANQFITTSDGAGTGDFTMMILAKVPAGSGAVMHMFAQKNDVAGTPFAQCALLAHSSAGVYSAGSVEFFTFNTATNVSATALAGLTVGGYALYTGVRQNGGLTLFNGQKSIASTAGSALNISQASRYTALGSRGNGTTEALSGEVAFAAAWDRALSAPEISVLYENIWRIFAPLTRTLISGTISRPGTDVSVAGWTFNGASLSASIGETTRDDAFYAEAAYGVSGAITALTLPLAAGSYIVTFAGEYLSAAAASGQFRFTALDGSNTSLGVSAWQSVTSAYAQYDVPITVTGGTATRLKIEIQA